MFDPVLVDRSWVSATKWGPLAKLWGLSPFNNTNKVRSKDFPSSKHNKNLDSNNIFRMTIDAYISAEKHFARNTTKWMSRCY